MNKYFIETRTYMKEQYSDKYWIDRDIIRPCYVAADNPVMAMIDYKEIAAENGIAISKTAMKNKNKMYIDGPDGTAKQIGYVITASTEIYDRSANIAGKKVYVELWVNIQRLENAF